MTGAEIIARKKKRGVAAEVFFGKLRVHAESWPDEKPLALITGKRSSMPPQGRNGTRSLASSSSPRRSRPSRRCAPCRGLDAGAEAFRHVVIEYFNETHPKTDPRVCAYCGGRDLPLTPTLPFGVGDRRTWLHRHCRDLWAEASAAESRSRCWRP